MRCKTVQKWLDPYLAQQLGIADRNRIEAHLRTCAVCRGELASQEQLSGLLRGDSTIPPVPEGFSGRVMAKARQRLAARRPRETASSSPRRWWELVSIPLRAEAAAVLAAGLLIGVFMGQQTWQSVHRATSRQATQADPSAVYQLDYLSDAPGGSLAESFLTLTGDSRGNGA